MKYIILITISLIFSACNSNESKVENTKIGNVSKADSLEMKDPERRQIFSITKKMFEKKGADFCETYHRFRILGIEVSKKAQALYPKDNVKFEKYGDEHFNKKTHQILSHYRLSDSLTLTVMIYGNLFCK